MPELNLRPDLLDRPMKFDLIEIEAVMLWPDDADRRAGFIRARDGMATINLIETSAQRWPGHELHAESVAMAMKRIADAPRMAEFEPEVKRRLEQGAIAGIILRDYLGLRELEPGRWHLEAVKAEVARQRGVSVSTINNTIWPRFKPVAHLWAALDARWSGPDRRFPCCPAGVRMFLAGAEHNRRIGESLRPRQASETLLDPKTTWKVPAALASRLPAVSSAYERNRSKGR